MISSSLNELTWRETTCFFYILRFVFFFLFYFDWISDADNTPEMDTDTGDIKGHKIRYTLFFYFIISRTGHKQDTWETAAISKRQLMLIQIPFHLKNHHHHHTKRQILRINGQANPRSHFLTLSNISHKFTKKKRNKYKIKFRRQRRINVKKG